MNKRDELYDKRVRWQETRIKQFSYVNYLVLGLSLATLGFAVSYVMEDGLCKTTRCTWFFWLHLLSLICLSASILFGIYCAYTRLKDFRKTAKIARWKYNRGNQTETPKIQKLRSKTKKLGQCSWCLLQGQLWSFGVGFTTLALAIALYLFDVL